ncbi:permease [Paenibacillus soyae]|uniref:Permease n=1 Tax=Paenibacillus soyae TaxID=2969249 RepID=A0A9X2MSK5_9BACL|nr:permease [Paenibacillus soyae]MCR2806171.1 permease [Paenibacillus soyae]
MRQTIFRYATPLLGLGCAIMLALILWNRELPGAISALLQSVHMQSFNLLFIGILLEAFPFILLGVLFSALLQVFVSDETIRKFTPRNKVAGILFGGLLGVVFPLCECGMIPVIRRLIRKGMPAYIGITYLLAGPIINPIVFSSTYLAFRASPEMVYGRMALALAVAMTIGLLFAKFAKNSPLRAASALHDHSDHHAPVSRVGRIKNKWSSTLAHASDELFDMGKYLIFGALLTAVIQTSLDRESIASVADQPLIGYMFMMAFAFLLSICSTSDAFIAVSFNGLFPPGALLAFLVFGPMVDLKNTLMMLSTFKLKVVLLLIALAFALTLGGSMLAEVLI